ncbi:MAG: glycosyltransferase family 87 protein [Chloroflexota bacterium]
MHSSSFGVRTLRDPRFQRLAVVLLAIILGLFRLAQFAAFTSQVEWGYDFAYYWRAAQDLLHGLPIYAPEQLVGPYVPQGQAGFLYPPPFAAAMIPFALAFPTDVRAAAWIWAALGALVLAVGTLAVARSGGLVERIRGASGLGPWILLVAALTFPPVVGELVLGNVHLLLFGLLSVAWLGVRRGDAVGDRWAGLAVGIAALVKVFPAFIVLWFLFTGRRRAAGWAVIGVLTAVALALPITGVAPWLDYPAALLNLSAPSDTTDTLAPTVWLASVVGFSGARMVVTATAVVTLFWAARRLPARPSFAVAVILSVLVAPALYHHYLAIMVLPFLLLLPDRGAPAWLAVAYLLMSGGQQPALGELSWIVNRGFPTAGALILLAVALRAGRVHPAPVDGMIRPTRPSHEEAT